MRAAGALEAVLLAGAAVEDELAGDKELAGDAGRGRPAVSTGAVSAGRLALDLAANAESLDTGFKGAEGVVEDDAAG